LGCMTCTAMYLNGATIITKLITTKDHQNWIHMAQRPLLPMFSAVDRGLISRFVLARLFGITILESSVMLTLGFASLESWISSVVILGPSFLARRPGGGVTELRTHEQGLVGV
jgi:hypothetical protein